jgi:uncharacterized protein YbjQ (UPF0145 family)
MKKILGLTVLLTSFLVAFNATARDTHHMYSLQEALNTPLLREELSQDIKLYFGNQTHPAIIKNFGEWKTNKKTHGISKSDKMACEKALFSALHQLQERARKLGGNAIVGIRSNYKNIERSSQTEYMCGSGALMSGVALKGDVVRLAR